MQPTAQAVGNRKTRQLPSGARYFFKNRARSRMATKITSDLHKQIGQLLIIGFDGTEMSPPLRSLLTRIQPAGVILFARNIIAAEQTYKLLKDCQSCVSARLFTCVDMEGGPVDRFLTLIGPSPSAAHVFASTDRKLLDRKSVVEGNSNRLH